MKDLKHEDTLLTLCDYKARTILLVLAEHRGKLLTRLEIACEVHPTISENGVNTTLQRLAHSPLVYVDQGSRGGGGTGRYFYTLTEGAAGLIRNCLEELIGRFER